MNSIHKWIVFLSAFLLTINVAFYTAFANEDEHKEKSRSQKAERKHSEQSREHNLTAVSNTAYSKNCGACHFAYQPELLPSVSWAKILADLADHFGEAVELDSESKKIIAEYLKDNAADYSSNKLSAKIMKSIGNKPPQRITEIPYIQKKHQDITGSVTGRESFGSLSNCSACHTTAEKGIYDDDNLKIPQ